MAALTGAATPYLSITPAGDGLGSIAAHTFILILECGDLRPARGLRNNMPCTNEAPESGKMPAKDAVDERSTGANQTPVCFGASEAFKTVRRVDRSHG